MPAIFCGFLCQEQTGALEEASAHVEGLGKSLKAKGVFDAYDFSHRDPWGVGKLFVKAVRMFARKKGVMVMNC